jgi:hypothetical protein
MTDPQRTITQVMEQLLAYVQHKRTCPKSTMVTFAAEPGWVTQSYVKPCTCGLDDLAAVLSGSREQKDQEVARPPAQPESNGVATAGTVAPDPWASHRDRFAKFEDDVAGHRVTVLRDDGVYRHLHCSSGSYVYQFDVITWPGYLAYTGDMGCFVFARIPDMFEFFRGRDGAVVDSRYLAEKAVAADKHDGIEEYSADLFRAAIKRDFDDYAERMPEDERASLWESIEDDVLCYADDGQERAVDAASGFQWRRDTVFPDFWEHRLRDFTGRFVWCCYAVPWAIRQYDALKAQSPAAREAGCADAVPTCADGENQISHELPTLPRSDPQTEEPPR